MTWTVGSFKWSSLSLYDKGDDLLRPRPNKRDKDAVRGLDDDGPATVAAYMGFGMIGSSRTFAVLE